MGSKIFLCDALRQYLLQGLVVLDGDPIKAALAGVNAYPETPGFWQSSQAVTVGQLVRPVNRNGHRYRCTIAGTTGSLGNEPAWPRTAGATVNDGTARWQEYGGDLAGLERWGDISAQEIGGGDYVAGGVALSGVSVVLEGTTAYWKAEPPVWPSLTNTMTHAFLYAAKTAGDLVNPLIGYVLLDDTPAPVSVSGVDFILNWNVSGIIRLR